MLDQKAEAAQSMVVLFVLKAEVFAFRILNGWTALRMTRG